MTASLPSERGMLWRLTLRPIARVVSALTAVVFLVISVPIALIARLAPKKVDIGLGPEPLINNVYHKRALQMFGYTAETFVDQVWYITSDFNLRGDLKYPGLLGFIRGYMLFMRAIRRYRCLYIYFNGGPLMSRPLVWRVEPLLYRLAGVKVVVMPYGGDVQDMSRSPNLAFKNAMAVDYPGHRKRRKRIAKQIDLWTKWADHVLFCGYDIDVRDGKGQGKGNQGGTEQGHHLMEVDLTLDRHCTTRAGVESCDLPGTDRITSTLLIEPRGGVVALPDADGAPENFAAAQTLAAFGEAARDETDLERLALRLVDVVERTMEPERVSLWLKPVDGVNRQAVQQGRQPVHAAGQGRLT